MSVSWIDVVVPIAVALIIIAVSIYLFSAYCHRNHPFTQLRRKASGMQSFPKPSSFYRKY